MEKLVCIGCPKGCNLTVDEENDYKVEGYSCEVGKKYGKQELTNPLRVLTTTIEIESEDNLRLPVKSNSELPKKIIFDAVKELSKVKVKAPIKTGDVIVKNILDSGVDIVSCKEILK